MNKAEIMRLADGYAIAVAQAPHSPRPAQKKLAEQRIEKARSALEAALEQQQAEPQTCLWLPWDDDAMPSTYHSACGEVFSFTEGGLQENGFRFCYACGGKVVDAAHNIQEPKS